MSVYVKEFHELHQFLGGYFHQGWGYDYYWKEEKPNFEAVVRHFKTEASPRVVNLVIEDLNKFLKLPLGEYEFDELVDDFTASGFSPLKTRREFLERVLDILREPNGVIKALTRR